MSVVEEIKGLDGEDTADDGGTDAFSRRSRQPVLEDVCEESPELPAEQPEPQSHTLILGDLLLLAANGGRGQ